MGGAGTGAGGDLRFWRQISAGALLHWALLIAAAALVGWIRLLPLSLGILDDDAALRARYQKAQAIAAGLPSYLPPLGKQERVLGALARWEKQDRNQFNAQREQIAAQLRLGFSFQDASGAAHIFLGDLDSYHWLRMARNYLHAGTTCDALVGGRCGDTYANAPVGRSAIYHRSLHIVAIVALHRLITFFKPAWPLQSSSFLVPVLAGVLGVFPAFALGTRLAGNLGGLCAALLVGVNPLFLSRSIGSDDDVWNVVLPLFVIWAASEAISASRARCQISFAAVAGLMVGLDAATWTGWTLACSVVLAALAADLLVETVGRGIKIYSGRRSGSDANLARTALVMAVFYLAAGIFTMPSRGSAGFALPFELMRKLIATPHPLAAARDTAWWPGVFSTVAELAPIDLRIIEFDMTGRFYFFVSMLGLLLLLLPKRHWRRQHLALLIGAGCIDWFVLSSNLGRVAAPALLAIPLVVAIMMDLFSDQELAEQRGAAFMVIAWFLVTLYLSYQGRRFAMLMAAPFAVAFAGAAGRVEQWAQEQISRLRPSLERFSLPVVFTALAAGLILPVKQGYDTARDYIPAMNGAWWSTLNALREQSPPDAIVNTWWDYGYWIEYVAQRRVNNDGASLETHIPYWTAHALAAPSGQESAGLLRMVDCGSDATPEPEGKEGAYGKLLSYGVDGLRAEDMVAKVAAMGRTQAKAYLAEEKLGAPAQADVLRSTHCNPPPAYLVLTTRMKPGRGWWSIANWDFRRAYVVRSAHSLPAAQATTELISRLGLSENDARTLISRAAALKSESDEQDFIAREKRTIRSPWIACGPWHDTVMICRASIRIDDTDEINGVMFRSDNPVLAHLLVVHRTPERSALIQIKEVRPGAVLIAGTQRLQDESNPESKYPGVGVLIDLVHGQARLDSPGLLRSTFSRLMYLDGRYDELFEKVHDETGFAGERVTLWKINWQGLESLD